MRSNYNKMDGELYFPGISYQKLAGNHEEFVVQPQVIIKKVDGAGVGVGSDGFFMFCQEIAGS